MNSNEFINNPFDDIIWCEWLHERRFKFSIKELNLISRERIYSQRFLFLVTEFMNAALFQAKRAPPYFKLLEATPRYAIVWLFYTKSFRNLNYYDLTRLNI